MRSIMAGVLPGSARGAPTRLDELCSFEEKAAARWRQLTGTLPPQVPPRLDHGFYDAGFAIEGSREPVSLAALRRLIQQEVRNHSGWPPFLTLSRAPYAPQPIDGAVEFWKGPDIDGSYDRPAHHDFWRISPDGFLFTRRGYPEDGGIRNFEPGATFDITTPTWRLGEAVLEASYIAKALGAAEARLICHGRWTALAGRELVSVGNPNRLVVEGRRATQLEFETVETVAVAALPDALPEIVFAMLSPLYELFDFFELPKRLVEEELAAMHANCF